MSLTLNNLVSLHNACIFTLINHSFKEFYPMYSIEPLKLLDSHLKELSNGTHSCSRLQELYDANDLEINVLKTKQEIEYLGPIKLIYKAIARDEFNIVYPDYVNLRESENILKVTYKIKVESIPDFRRLEKNVNSTYTELYNAHVYAVPYNGSRKLIGVFSSYGEAYRWIDSVFPDRSNITPVIADNELTKEYFNSR